MDCQQAFIEESRRYLKGEYLPKIRSSLEDLSEEDIWWRPHREANSIGNLLLHLAGNIRQWVVAGIGGAPDTRRRQEEFDRQDGMTAEELVGQLEEALREVDEVLAALSPDDLSGSREIQGLPVSVFQALFHVVEHFSMHAGQIIYLSKLHTGRDLGFYRLRDGKVETRW